MAKILIVEDEQAICDLIYLSLEREGYDCVCAEDGMKAADLMESNHFDLVLLDIMLPYVDGYELMEYIRPLNIPAIFLTAKNQITDKVRGLHMGAEDYIVKPFDVSELVARVEVVLRRFHKSERKLEYDEYTIDLESQNVRRQISKEDAEVIELTPKEFKLFVLFVQNKGRVLYRESLFEQVWESEYSGDTRTVDLHVQRLRKKIKLESRLKTVYKMGYRLESE